MPDSLSAFKDLRVTELTPKLSWRFKTSITDDAVATAVTGSGTVTVSNTKAVLQTGAATSSTAKVRTVGIITPSPGLGVLVRLSAIFTAGVAGSTQIIGIGDDSNGFFFGYNGETFGVLHRQNGLDNWITQASWNYDKLTGVGSGFTLDPTKGNVYTICYETLGFGDVRFGIEDPTSGEAVLVHNMVYVNAYTETGLYNQNLPLLAQVINTTNSTNISLHTPGAAAFIDGVPAAATSGAVAAALGNVYSAATGTTSVPSHGYLILQLSNPAGSGKACYIQRLVGGAISETKMDFMRDATFASAGTTLTPRNLNFAFSDNSSMTAKYISDSTDPTSGGALLSSTIQTGGTTIIDTGGGMILPPGHTLLVRLHNLKTGISDLTVNISWAEILI